MPKHINKADTIHKDGWLCETTKCISTHFDNRELDIQCPINVLVIHNISLPPAEKESDFDNTNVEDFFTGKLNSSAHPYFMTISELRVSAHLYIKRTGEVIQFVALDKRAWHAGKSEFNGKSKCNDFSIGIELQGTDLLPYTDEQYSSLHKVTAKIQTIYPHITLDNIVGHNDISPGRKTDPGPSFDWHRYKSRLKSNLAI